MPLNTLGDALPNSGNAAEVAPTNSRLFKCRDSKLRSGGRSEGGVITPILPRSSSANENCPAHLNNLLSTVAANSDSRASLFSSSRGFAPVLCFATPSSSGGSTTYTCVSLANKCVPTTSLTTGLRGPTKFRDCTCSSPEAICFTHCDLLD